MTGALRAPRDFLPPLPVAAALVVLAGLNASLTIETLADMLRQDTASDWRVLSAAANHGLVAGLYGGALYQWSPLLVPVLQLLVPLGLAGWRVLHLAAALLLPSWKLRLLVLASWPFWFDFSVANVLTFIVLAAAWALRGSKVAALVYLALTILIPRPLMLPLAAWLLWKQPGTRWPFLAIASVIGILTLATGLTGEWIATLIGSATHTGQWSAGGPAWDYNVGPSRWLGVWWVAIGLPLAAWLTMRNRVGLASLAASPYWLPYYLLFALLPKPGNHESAQERTERNRDDIPVVGDARERGRMARAG